MEAYMLTTTSSSAAPRGGNLESQDSIAHSEDWASEEEEDDYNQYYGEDDLDVNGEHTLHVPWQIGSYLPKGAPGVTDAW